MDTSTEDHIRALPEETRRAYQRIQKYIWKTPLLHCKHLSGQAQVYFKLESEQTTGSLKPRGATNKLLFLLERDPHSLDKGFITASTGSHGVACAHVADVLGYKLTVYCRHGVPEAKLSIMKMYGADVVSFGQDIVETAMEARRVAKKTGQVYIPPYNDWDIMAGLGTTGYEIYEELPSVDSVFVSVGGGGCIGGIAAYLKSRNRSIEIVGCSAANSCEMHESVRAGRQVHTETMDTISDGTAGGVEVGSVTFPVCCRFVDRWVDVSEDQIGAAVYWMLDKHHKVIEGAAGVALAAYMSCTEMYAGKNVVMHVCGAGIGPIILKHILEKYGPSYGSS